MVGHESLEITSVLGWLACNECSDFIEKGDRERLIRKPATVIKRKP